jgi:protein phosphatase
MEQMIKGYDIIGDIHGCYDELVLLLDKLGYVQYKNLFIPPDNRILVSVGDVVDRGPNSSGTFRLIANMVRNNYAKLVLGNHDSKIWRWAKGNKVKIYVDQEKTIDSFRTYKVEAQEIIDFFSTLPYYLLFDNLVVAHAAWKESLLFKDPFDDYCKPCCLFGPTTGEMVNDFPVRIDWAAERTNKSKLIVYGHTARKEIYSANNAICVDTGCVFGNKLTALRYPEMEIVSVQALMEYSKKEII